MIENDVPMDIVKNINDLTWQNNFTNLYLGSLREQMTFLTNRVYSVLGKVQEVKDSLQKSLPQRTNKEFNFSSTSVMIFMV